MSLYAYSPSRQAELATVWGLLLLGPPVLVSAVLWVTSPNPIMVWEALAAFLMLCLPWWSYWAWRVRGTSYFPLFALVAFTYWIYFGLPLFWGNRNAVGVHAAGKFLSEDVVAQAVGLVLLGVLALGAGMHLRLSRWYAPRLRADVIPTRSRWLYVRVILLVGGLLNAYEAWPLLLGEAGRQVLIILQTTVPTVAFVLICRRILRNEANLIDKAVLSAYVLLRVMGGLASGWLGDVPFMVLAVVAVYVGERRRIPFALIGLIAAAILFLQPGKNAVRSEFWTGDAQAGQIERVAFWFTESLRLWSDALFDPSQGGWSSLAYQSLARLNLLNQTSNVIDLTPALVPYQGTQLYSYMAITLIPRALWPDKPSISESNRFYQLAYDLTTEDRLDSVTISVGVLTEAYISFGWLGVAGVMFLLGLILDFVEGFFLHPRSGSFLIAAGIMLTLAFARIEAQLAQYLGGVLQNLLVTLLVFLPVVRWRIRQTVLRSEVAVQAETVQPQAAHAGAGYAPSQGTQSLARSDLVGR